jgi:ubiquinone/menaquinone biosynthesis C-methylase UbiE
VLDLACGTGLVARLAASTVELGQVTGLDINTGMLAVARSLSTPPRAAITWVEASAADTGLPHDSFEVVLCQQGLQMGPYHRAVGDALERFLSVEAATEFRSTRLGVPDDAALRQLFMEAGFRAVQVRPSTMVVHLLRWRGP